MSELDKLIDVMQKSKTSAVAYFRSKDWLKMTAKEQKEWRQEAARIGMETLAREIQLTEDK